MKLNVPVKGLEPPLPYEKWILNPSRLPIPPHRHYIFKRRSVNYETNLGRVKVVELLNEVNETKFIFIKYATF